MIYWKADAGNALMTTLLFGRAKVIGRMRYFFFDRYYSRTVRIFFIVMAIGMTGLSTLLFRNLNAGGAVKGFIPILLLMALMGFVAIYANLQIPAILILVISMLLSAKRALSGDA